MRDIPGSESRFKNETLLLGKIGAIKNGIIFEKHVSAKFVDFLRRA
jgi:hypothetical protein